VPSSTKLFEQVEDALADARILDRDLMRELLELAKSLEIALLDACRNNLEMKSADRNVAAASNELRDAVENLNKAYTGNIQVDSGDVESLFESQLTLGRNLLNEKNNA
jgi:hypothetical protein